MRWFVRIGLMIIASGLAFLALSCAGSSRRAEPLPTVRAIRPATQPDIPSSENETTRPIKLLTRRIDLPLNASLEKAWSLIESHDLDPAMLTSWQANGLRVGLLDAARDPDFLKALPDTLGLELQILILADTPMGLPVGAKLESPRSIELTTPRGQSVQTFPAGRPQFLLSRQRTHDNAIILELIPHDFFPQVHMVPISPLQAQRDGRLFPELALRVALPRHQVLVVIWIPPPQSAATQPSTQPNQNLPPLLSTDTAATQPATQPEKPSRLGDLFLTSSRFHQPIQHVLMIGLADQ